MLIYLILSIFISLFLYYVVNTIEPFSMPYVPLKKRDLTRKPKINLDTRITNPQKTYYASLRSFQDYINLQRKIRNAFEVERSNSSVNARVASDLRWRIHRWSMWDYLPNLDHPYYCRVTQFNGKETCQPLSNKLYCSVNNLYNSPAKCLNSLKNNKDDNTQTN
jgi:hypothetical protein